MDDKTKELIEWFDKKSGLYGTEKRDVINQLIKQSDNSRHEVEKYKIDRMIEAGLLQDKTFDEHLKRDVIKDLVSVITNTKFHIILAMVLSFTLLLFNSSNFWKIRMIQENKVEKSK